MSGVISIERDGADAARAALERTIAAGGVAVFPADGLYGLACDPLDATAIARIHRIKGRDDGKPSAVMYLSPLAMRELVANPERRYPLACREDAERLGVRLIEGPLAGAVCPLFQTSANLSGKPAPGSFEAVPAEIVEAVDLAIDGGALTGQPSTVVDLTAYDDSGAWTILREGALARSAVRRAVAVGQADDPN